MHRQSLCAKFELLTAKVNNAISAQFVDINLCLLSQVQLFGHTVIKSPCTYSQDEGIELCQLPLFTHNPSAIVCEESYWIRNMNPSKEFLAINKKGELLSDYGIFTYSMNDANGTTYNGFRPVFCIG